MSRFRHDALPPGHSLWRRPLLRLPRKAWSLDEAFPLGDGTAQTEASAVCPCCHQSSTIALDPGSGSRQEYTEDCQVCCRPWRVIVRYGEDGGADVRIEPEDGA